MVISNNRQPTIDEFYHLVSSANSLLNEDAQKRAQYYLTRHAQRLEDDVLSALNTAAQGTAFQGSLVKISGQRFPDIVANQYYGVEVKSSKDESWTTLGGSVNESTRAEGVERIFLTFGKLTTPIEFRSRPYEECLSEVVVTHYPRYKINMNLPKGETIFDKMDTNYDELRNSHNPVGKIVSYYKSRLKDGERVWWIDGAEDADRVSSASMTVRLWKTLSVSEKHELMMMAFAFFPNILSTQSNKYEDFSLWLVSQYGIISTSMRDTFSAGGQEAIATPREIFISVPQVVCKINKHRTELASIILTANPTVLMENWRVSSISKDRLGQWIELVSSNLSMRDYDTKRVFNAIFERG